MENTKQSGEMPELILPQDYNILYNCLNGKGNSCIHGREIATDRVNCALRKVFGRNGDDIIKRMNVIERANQLEEVPGSQLYNERFAVVEAVKQKFGLSHGFEILEGFRPGADVSTKDKNRDEAILKKIMQESTPDFLKRVSKEVAEYAQKNKKLLAELFPIEKFAAGDNIEMRKEADEEYKYSQSGSKGVVLKSSRYSVVVKFSYLTGAGGEGRIGSEREIDPKLMINKTPKKKVKKTLKEILGVVEPLIDSIMSNVLDDEEGISSGECSEKLHSLRTKKLLDEKFLVPIGDGNYALNFSDVTKFVAPNLHKMYADPNLYSSSIMFEPPAERQPNVLRLQLTDGCNYGACTFCNGYNGVKFSSKNFEQFKKHVDDVRLFLEGYEDEITRVFIGSGNALDVDQEVLKKSIAYVERKFDPNRIAMYGNTNAMLHKGKKSLRELQESGLGLLYRGAETGSDDVLKYVNKGNTLKEMVKASDMVNDADIKLSIMLMPGLGGKRFYDEHVQGTVKLLNHINCKYITFMTLNPSTKSAYAKIMDREIKAGTNRPLTEREIVQQTKDILDQIVPRGQKIGMFGSEIDIVGANPITFKATLDYSGKTDALSTCYEYLMKHK